MLIFYFRNLCLLLPQVFFNIYIECPFYGRTVGTGEIDAAAHFLCRGVGKGGGSCRALTRDRRPTVFTADKIINLEAFPRGHPARFVGPGGHLQLVVYFHLLFESSVFILGLKGYNKNDLARNKDLF